MASTDEVNRNFFERKRPVADDKIKIEIKDGIMHFAVPVDDPPKLSETGKTLIVATSGGWKKVTCNGIKFSIYVKAYTYPDLWKLFKDSKPRKPVSAEHQKQIEAKNRKVTAAIAKKAKKKTTKKD